jgi:hypothetical protein
MTELNQDLSQKSQELASLKDSVEELRQAIASSFSSLKQSIESSKVELQDKIDNLPILVEKVSEPIQVVQGVQSVVEEDYSESEYETDDEPEVVVPAVLQEAVVPKVVVQEVVVPAVVQEAVVPAAVQEVVVPVVVQEVIVEQAVAQELVVQEDQDEKQDDIVICEPEVVVVEQPIVSDHKPSMVKQVSIAIKGDQEDSEDDIELVRVGQHFLIKGTRVVINMNDGNAIGYLDDSQQLIRVNNDDVKRACLVHRIGFSA